MPSANGGTDVETLVRPASVDHRGAVLAPPAPAHRPLSLTVARLLTLLAACVLGGLALDRLVRGLAAIKLPVEAMYGEAIIYGQAARLLHGQPLYQALDRPPFTVVAYTPVYYALVAGLRLVFGPGFGPGRIATFAAGLAAAVLVGVLVTKRTGSGWAALFAGVLFLGLAFPGDYPWFAFYKEDILGVALSLGAVVALGLGNADERRYALLAGILAGLAFLTKQTFVSAGLAGLVWYARQDRRTAVIFVASGLIVAAVPSAWLTLSSDGAYVANTVQANMNPVSSEILRENLATLARYQAIPIALVLLPLLLRRISFRDWLRDPVTTFWVASLVVAAATLGKVGSNWNYWMEAAAATAVLATCGIWSLALGNRTFSMGSAAGMLALAGVCVSPMWLPPPAADLATVAHKMVQPDEQQAIQFARVLDRVHREPRIVLAQPLDGLTLADRDIYMEPYITSVLYREGKWDPDLIMHQICTGQIGLLVLDHPLEGPDWEYQGYTDWPAPVLATLREVMHLEQARGGLYLYTPDPASACH